MRQKKKLKSFALALRRRARAATLLIALLCGVSGAWADELTVFAGSSTTEYVPAYITFFDKYTRSQYIIPSSNLVAMNGKTIMALKYYSDHEDYTSTCNVDVYLKEVSYTTFNAETPTFETKSGIVYTGTVSIASDGTLTITFTMPYTYNGGNLLIGMENTEKGNHLPTYFYGQQFIGTAVSGQNDDNLANVSPTRRNFIPKTTFTHATAVDLGLPSGTKWADMNVGAGSTTGIGTYFEWGETTAYDNNNSYGGSGQSVSLELTAETRSGYQFKQYAASQGTLSGETTNMPTLTMPAANSTANDAVTISAEYDPLYNADFASGNDNDGWTIDPTQQIAGGTVTVSYTGENKVKSGTVKKLALCSLSEVTNEHVGKIIGADGNVYASLAQAEKVTTAVGILGKVTETGHGLIMSLEDAPKQVWATIDGWASASYAGTTLKVLPDDDARGSNLPSYTTLGSTTVSNWAVATRADYTAIFTNLGSTRTDSDGITYDEHVNAYITGAGGTAISGENWSSTGYTDAKAWRFSYDNKWGARDKTTQFKVRPVLGF